MIISKSDVQRVPGLFFNPGTSDPSLNLPLYLGGCFTLKQALM